MIQNDDGFLGQCVEQDDPATARAIADLHCAYAATPPAHLSGAMDRAVGAAMAVPRDTHSPVPHRRRVALRLISLGAALLLALGGAGGYLHFSSSTPVSAQTVLRHAAAALAPGQVSHLTYTVTVSGDHKGAGTGTAEVWIQANASGSPDLSAQTLTMSNNGAAPVGRYVQVGDQVYAYDASHDAILLAQEARENPSWVLPNNIFNGAGIAQYLSALAPQSPQRIQLLPQQTLDGHLVDVVRVDGWTDRPAQRTILYFDAESYLLRGFDASSLDPSYPTPSWQVRLSAAATMAATAVPSGTFTLNAPATARVYPPQPDLAAFGAVCHSGANVKGLLKSGQSLLAACRATAPGVTASILVAALAAPAKATLDAAAAAGVITPAQEAGSLVWLNAQITSMVVGTAGN
jgi:hypothetical protein